MHGVEHFAGDVRGAGGVQETIAGDAAWAVAVHSNRVFVVLEERQFIMLRERTLCATDARTGDRVGDRAG
jgi:hypothetical protein